MSNSILYYYKTVCNCKNLITVNEYEGDINCPGILTVQCTQCNKEHQFELTTNVSAATIWGANFVSEVYLY